MKNDKTETPRLTPRKKAVFFLITVSIPVVFLVVLEVALRIFGYGVSMSLFKKHVVWGKTYYQMNPDVKYRYFGTSRFQPATTPTFFQVPKPKGVYRIFCLGESTTAGYPFYFNGAFPAYLQTRLDLLFPNRKIEVINLGMVATNSYTALDITRELARYQPNLIIYYGGHNEFYGALGVASNLSVGSYRAITELYLKLVRLRTFQLVRNVIQGIVGLFVHQNNNYARGTEMQQVAHGRLVPYESSMYKATYRIFKDNLEAMKRYCRSEGIPIIMGTQVSDLRDQPPFVSGNTPGMSEPAVTVFQALFKDGIALQSEGEWDSAATDYRKAIALNPLYADAHYRLAQCLDTTGSRLKALQQYTIARNYDELRFRTDSNFNGLIRSMNNNKYCFVADVVKAFKAASPDSLIGHNLIFEHLHPNSRGAFLIAKCYADVMSRAGLLASQKAWEAADTVSEAEIWHDRLVTTIDEDMAKASVDWLTSGWPFKDKEPSLRPVPRTDTLEWISEQAVAGKVSWIGAHAEAINYFERRGNWNEVADIYRSLLSLSPLDLQLHSDLAQAYMKDNNYPLAAKTMLSSAEIFPDYQTYKTLGDIMMRLSRPDSAVEFYLKMKDFASTQEEKMRSGLVLGYAFARAGQYQDAETELTELLQDNPNFAMARKLLDDVRALEHKPQSGK